MTNQFQQAITEARASLAAVEAFAAEYVGKIPANFPGHLFAIEKPRYTVSMMNMVRLPPTVLRQAIQLFGAANWSRKRNFEGMGFDWLKMVGGVEIALRNAEAIPEERDCAAVDIEATLAPFRHAPVTV